jgi:CRP-like cAMP-binding protein
LPPFDAGKPIEVGLIGYEGMTGLAIVFDHDRNEHETFMQAAVHAGERAAQCYRQEQDAVHRALLRYAHAFLNQATRTAVANGRSKIEERLARWLLMAQDRVRSPELPLTHEFLAMMLGVRRSGVTVAVQHLEREGVIVKRRGHRHLASRGTGEAIERSVYPRRLCVALSAER